MNRFLLLASLLLTFGTLVAAQESEAKSILRTYSLDRIVLEPIHRLAVSEYRSTHTNEFKYVDPFDPLGSFSPFSSTHDRSYPLNSLQTVLDAPDPFHAHLLGDTLAIVTTPAGHQNVTELIDSLSSPLVDQKVEVTCTFIEFPFETVTAHPEFREMARLSEASVLELHREGKSSLLDMVSLTTFHGVNAQTEAVEEILYPTEFEAEVAKSKNSPEPGFVPSAFETREIGSILNCTAIIAADQQSVTLHLIPEFCELLGWDDHSGKHKDLTPNPTPVSQPRFRSFNLTTSVNLPFDTPGIVYGAKHPDRNTMVYGIVSARLVE